MSCFRFANDIYEKMLSYIMYKKLQNEKAVEKKN